MHHLIGNKNHFAVEIDFMTMTPRLWGKTALWINGIQVGDFEDENILGPFIGSLARVISYSNSLWNPQFEGLNCEEIFYTIDPVFDDPDSFYDLPDAEQEALEQLDIFSFAWGENFDDWVIYVIVKDELCKMIWFYDPDRGLGNKKAKGSVQCFEVPLADIKNVYRSMCNLIPDRYWPTLIKKLA
jgi:Immunity protein 42